MANQLKMADIQAIQALARLGWSYRRIARELGVDRDTVSRHARQEQTCGANPAIALPGSADEAPASNLAMALTGSADEAPASNAAMALTGSVGGRLHLSAAWPWREVIRQKLEQGLDIQRIYQDLIDPDQHHGYAGSYHSVRRLANKLLAVQPLPVRRMECEAGGEAQVDFGRGAVVVESNGRRRTTWVFRIVLSHCRKGYSQAVFRQSTDDFLRCLENAFAHFGGVPRTLVIDNLRAAVSRADWFDPEINPKLQSFCAHYNIVPLPTRPRTPRHKGKVERGIAYVQANALKARTFRSLAEQNLYLLEWETSVADTRIHGTTRRQVKEVFEQVERPALQRLAGERFPFFQEGQRSVHRDGHVEVAKAYYSLAPEDLGRRVWVRWDGRLVRIYDGQMRLIATHVRREPGQFSTHDGHILDRKIAGVERGASWMLQRIGLIGPQAQRWGEALVQSRGIEAVRVLQGLLSLAERHTHQQVNHACSIALEHQAWRLRTIRRLLERPGRMPHAHRQLRLPELLDEHPIIRSLADYGQLVHRSFLQPLETGT
jgi:transposase